MFQTCHHSAHCQTFLQTSLRLFFSILNKLLFECANEEHQNEDTKPKWKSIRITNCFNTYDEFYFMWPETFVSTLTFRNTKTLATLQNSIIYSIEWLNNKLSNGEFVVNANRIGWSIESYTFYSQWLHMSMKWSVKCSVVRLFSKCCLIQYLVINADSETLSCYKR